MEREEKNPADVFPVAAIENARLLQRIATRGNMPHREAAQGTA